VSIHYTSSESGNPTLVISGHNPNPGEDGSSALDIRIPANEVNANITVGGVEISNALRSRTYNDRAESLIGELRKEKPSYVPLAGTFDFVSPDILVYMPDIQDKTDPNAVSSQNVELRQRTIKPSGQAEYAHYEMSEAEFVKIMKDLVEYQDLIDNDNDLDNFRESLTFGNSEFLKHLAKYIK
jgi:hypothetical protein